jgi:hypothetical protein
LKPLAQRTARRAALWRGAAAAVLTLWLSACGGAEEGAPATAPAAAPPNPPRTVTVVAAGDIADCGNDGTMFPMATLTAALVSPSDSAVLTLGDNTYPIGAPKEFSDCLELSWGPLKSRIRPSPGNHDYMTTDAAGYFAYFGAAAGPGRRGYYSYELGAWHVVALNSNVDASIGSPQYLWLQRDLADAVGARCTLAYWHHPVFSSGPHGNDPKMAEIYRLLHAAGAELVLVGHDHVYERFAPQDADGRADPERGIRSFTAGTGGARLYSWKTVRENSEFRDNSAHGLLRLDLEESGYRWAFVPVGGGPPRDEGRGDCHP